MHVHVKLLIETVFNLQGAGNCKYHTRRVVNKLVYPQNDHATVKWNEKVL